MVSEIIEVLTTSGETACNILSIAGNVAAAREIKNFLRRKAPFLYSDWKFWDNVDKFFNGGVLSDNDKQNLIEKLSDGDNIYENGTRFLDIIRQIDTNKKMTYILNATKALLNATIELPEYFRISHIVMNTLEEDLQFLKAHINEETIPYSIEVSGLVTVGLVYAYSIRDNQTQNYAFTELAKMVTVSALASDANLNAHFDINKSPQTNFIATDEEFEAILNNIFGKVDR